MKKLSSCLLMAAMALSFVALAQVSAPTTAQDQKDLPVVTRMMAYGKKQPGKVSRDEVTDERLLKLFDLADTNKEGVVTKEQLVVAAKKLEAEQPQGGQRAGAEGGGPRGAGGPGGGGGFGGGPGGGRGGFGGGPGGQGGFGGRPQIGVVMSKFVQDELSLSETQRQQVADLQKELDTKLANILNEDQQKKYKEMKENPGRGGPNGPGGPNGGGPNGRGGPPRD